MHGTEMRLDLKPLCPKHRDKMTLADLVLRMLSDLNRKTCYRCPAPGCDYHYHVWQGYFTVRQGERMQPDVTLSKQCLRDGNHMYIAKSSERETRWQCGIEGCDYSEAVATTAP